MMRSLKPSPLMSPEATAVTLRSPAASPLMRNPFIPSSSERRIVLVLARLELDISAVRPVAADPARRRLRVEPAIRLVARIHPQLELKRAYLLRSGVSNSGLCGSAPPGRCRTRSERDG